MSLIQQTDAEAMISGYTYDIFKELKEVGGNAPVGNQTVSFNMKVMNASTKEVPADGKNDLVFEFSSNPFVAGTTFDFKIDHQP